MAKKTETKEIETIKLTLEIPLGDLPEGYEANQAAAGRANIGDRSTYVGLRLPADHARLLIRIRNALRAANVELTSGKRVESNADVLRWLMEKIAPSLKRAAESAR